jgi:surfeit locus 1 family protein
MSRGSAPTGGNERAHRAGIEAPRIRASRRVRPRLLPTLAAIAAVTVCAAAGHWQQGRMHAKEGLREQLDAAGRAEPVPLASLPPDADWAALRFRPVIATGEYLASRQILIDNKVHAGRAGYHVVTPMKLADGRVVLVNRGWTPQGASRSSVPAAVPPAGVRSVRGRVAIPAAEYFELRPEAPAGPVWQNLDPARFGTATGIAVLPVVVEATVAPMPNDGFDRAWPAPDFGIETHRIYMVQWYSFALLTAILWLWFNRPQSARAGDG